MPTRRDPTRKYSRRVESADVYGRSVDPPEVVSALTPEGTIQAYGNIFAAMRGARGWRRATAIAITSFMCVPVLIIVIGAALAIMHAL